MDQKELKRRRNAYSIFDDLPVKILIDFFSKPQMLKVFKEPSGFYNWTHPFFKTELPITSPWLVRVSQHVNSVGHDFDCRDFIKDLLRQEITRDGKFTVDHRELLNALKMNSDEFKKRDEQGFLTHPECLLYSDMPYLTQKNQADAFLKKLTNSWTATLSYDTQGTMISWTTLGLEKDRRHGSLWKLTDTFLAGWTPPAPHAVLNVDICDVLKGLVLRQLYDNFSSRFSAQPNAFVQEFPGLKTWLPYFAIDPKKNHFDFLYQLSLKLTDLLASDGMGGSLDLTPLFATTFWDRHLETLAASSGNVACEMVFESDKPLRANSLELASEKCAKTLRTAYKVHDLVFESLQAEPVSENIELPASDRFRATIEIPGMGPSVKTLKSYFQVHALG